jgi:hypothetical protein
LIHSDLEVCLHMAFVVARQKRYATIGIEHLLLALTTEPTAVAALKACKVDIDLFSARLEKHIEENTPRIPQESEVDTQPTIDFQRSIQRAILHVTSTNLGQPAVVRGVNVLVAIFAERDTFALSLLSEFGVTRKDVVDFYVNGTKKETKLRDDDSFPFVNQIVASEKIDTSPRPKVFISYCHTDKQVLDRLLVHLKPFERESVLVCWSDTRIKSGDKWKDEIARNLEDAVIAVLLISADFLASDFIVNNELPPILLKAETAGLRVLPVIVKPCGFTRNRVLGAFQSANDPKNPLLGMSTIEQEALYDKVADEVAREADAKKRNWEA